MHQLPEKTVPAHCALRRFAGFYAQRLHPSKTRKNAEIEAATEFLEWDEAQRQMVEAGNLIPPVFNGGLIKQIENPEALGRCLELLNALKDSIAHRGFLLEIDKNTLGIVYGEFDSKHWRSTPFESYLHCSTMANYPPEKLEGLGVTQ